MIATRRDWLAAVVALHVAWIVVLVLLTARTPEGLFHPFVVFGLALISLTTLPFNLVVAAAARRLDGNVRWRRAATAAVGVGVWLLGWTLLGTLSRDRNAWLSLLPGLLIGGALFGVLVPTGKKGGPHGIAHAPDTYVADDISEPCDHRANL